MVVQVRAFNGHADVTAYPDTPLPNGDVAVRGSANGLSFPIDVRPSSQLTMFDGTFARPLNVSFTGIQHVLICANRLWPTETLAAETVLLLAMQAPGAVLQIANRFQPAAPDCRSCSCPSVANSQWLPCFWKASGETLKGHVLPSKI